MNKMIIHMDIFYLEYHNRPQKGDDFGIPDYNTSPKSTCQPTFKMHVNLPLPKENRKFTAFLDMQIWQIKLYILGELGVPIRLRFPFVQVSRFA